MVRTGRNSRTCQGTQTGQGTRTWHDWTRRGGTQTRRAKRPWIGPGVSGLGERCPNVQIRLEVRGARGLGNEYLAWTPRISKPARGRWVSNPGRSQKFTKYVNLTARWLCPRPEPKVGNVCQCTYPGQSMSGARQNNNFANSKRSGAEWPNAGVFKSANCSSTQASRLGRYLHLATERALGKSEGCRFDDQELSGPF